MTNYPVIHTIENLLEEKKGLRKEQVLHLFYQASRSFEVMGLKEEATEVFERCAHESKKTNNIWLYYLSSIHLAQINATLGNWDKVNAELNLAKEVLPEIKDQGKIEYYLAESFVNLYRGNIEKTHSLLNDVSTKFELRGIQKANVLINIGNTYIDLEEYEKAIDSYRMALEYSAGNPMSQGSSAINLALALVLAGRPDEAKQYIEQAKEIAANYNIKPLMGIVYLNESKYFLSKKDYENALKSLNLSLEIFKESKDKYYEIGSKITLARVYHAMGENSKARETIDDALKESQDMGYKLREAEIYEVLASWGDRSSAQKAAEIHRSLGNTKKADKILKKYT